MAGFKKYVKKGAKNLEKMTFGSKGFKGRYGIGKGKGGLKLGQIAKDLAMVKSRLNVEKKYIDNDIATSTVGQVDANLDGYNAFDVTTQIAQGVTRNQRIGDSLKLTGMSFPIQFSSMDSTLSDRRIRVTLLKVRSADNGVTATEACEAFWDVNPLTLVRDYNCPTAYRNSKTDGIVKVRSSTYKLKGPQLDNGSVGISPQERSALSIKFNVKLNDVWRYNNGGSFPDGIRYYLVFQTDLGNRSGSTNSVLDVPVQTFDSGVVVRLAQRTWFVDN